MNILNLVVGRIFAAGPIRIPVISPPAPVVNATPTGAAALIGDSAKAACGTACGTSSITQVFHNVTTVLLFLIGSISVIMIIIGGLRYVLANGDSKSAEAGRNTILYAVIGVILSISAYAIIAFVTANFH